MKNILQNIFEASGKPSDLKKYKGTERKETVHFKSGDIYDLSDPGYDDEFKYYDASGNGYIKDKAGHVYDVIASDQQGDAGRIAGGSHDYNVTIKKANGKDDFYVHGWSAIMSEPHNADCISDIKAGYYLEDYIAKYYSSYSHGDKFKELAEKGDKNAKPYTKQKEEKLQQKKDEFYSRYATIPENIGWEIVDGKFNFTSLRLTSKSAEKLRNEKDKFLKQKYPGKYSDSFGDDPEYKKFIEQIKKTQEDFEAIVKSVLQPVCEARLSEVFKTKDLNKLSGIAGYFGYKQQYIPGIKHGYAYLAVDTKKKIFVVIDSGTRKIVDNKIELQLSDNITVVRDKASKEMFELFKKVSDAWKKAEGRKQSEYVANNWQRIQKEAGGYWKWNKTQAQAKAEAKAEYQEICKKHDFGDVSKKSFTYSLALIQLYVQGDMEPDAEPVEKPLENPEPEQPKKERGKNTVMGKGAYAAAYDKMKAWHEGTRKQNLSNCSDAKLKMNYKVCKELGYEAEMKKIEDEAKKRDIVLESISLAEIVNADYEIED